jgi:hypothetical protein
MNAIRSETRMARDFMRYIVCGSSKQSRGSYFDPIVCPKFSVTKAIPEIVSP